jgi:alkylation response protein AidB-like acyl-CoA dehydrogenase
MNFELSEGDRMLRDLVERFVCDELAQFEAGALKLEAAGQGWALPPGAKEHLDKVSSGLGLWGLDAPVEAGGMGLSYVSMRPRRHERIPGGSRECALLTDLRKSTEWSWRAT